ncbi:MAG: hypothetical protein DWQ02_23640 [Bacteroidetes bacterium]|nr:MAG: hypothetical protein DWQ02_23640 [Bacteroidota bacterium]
MNTFSTLLKTQEVPIQQLEQDYNPMLKIVKVILGLDPNANPLLEIWPPAFKAYNLVVPNFLNLPQYLFKKRSYKSLVGLAMYACSKAAECAYCTSHACTFAMRRGLEAEKFKGNLSEKEAAVVAVAESMARVPSNLTKAQCDEMISHCTPAEIHGVAMVVSLMGFLNKFMGAMGVELEAEALEETGKILTEAGWNPGKHFRGNYQAPEDYHNPVKDSIGTYFRMFQQAPGVIRLEKKWTQGIPDKYPKAGAFLKEHTGFDFPMIAKTKDPRIIKTLSTVLRDNLNAEVSKIGLDTKCLSSLVFGMVAQNEILVKEARILINHHASSVQDNQLEVIEGMAKAFTNIDDKNYHSYLTQLTDEAGLSEKQAAALLCTKMASYSPSDINETILNETHNRLSAQEIVELMIWISIQQMFQRMYTYYSVSNG